MTPIHQWVEHFTVTAADLEYLTNMLLEKETPMSTREFALALIQQRIDEETSTLQERYKDAAFYNPSHSYREGQRLIFSQMDYATARVVGLRPGDNPEYGDFSVITVLFDEEQTDEKKQRDFATELGLPHRLSAEQSDQPLPGAISSASAEEILAADENKVLTTLESALRKQDVLVQIGGMWFARDLVMEIDMGHLHLAEAVLDMLSGGPLSTMEIIEQIGGLGNAPESLQVFSLNYALTQDKRFDEVGPRGKIMWHLTALEPEIVRQCPPLLRYTGFNYDPGLLTGEMLSLEAEIDDELSSLTADEQAAQARVTLIYPHRRLGTLPLNAQTSRIFPTASTPRIYVTLVDGQDGTHFPGWVVHEHGYVCGLLDYYTRHHIPVGAYLSVQPGDEPGQVVISHDAYRPRTEWVRVVLPKGNQVEFESKKRSIGAGYDDLMLLGVDDLQAVDEMVKTINQQQKSLAGLLKVLIPGLARLTPQGAVHFKTLYSVVNIFRRCPPGPLLAMLAANPDFADMGGHYWKLSE